MLHRRCESIAIGTITLDLHPDIEIKPFSLGMPICETFDYGFHLHFNPWCQRLRLIKIFDVKRLQMHYSTSLIGGQSTLTTFLCCICTI
ncbi:UPF0183 protein, partial [Mucuna pruriens]